MDGIGDAVEVEILRGSIGLHRRSGVLLVSLFASSRKGIEKVMQTGVGRECECLVLRSGCSLGVVLGREIPQSSSAFSA